MKNGGFFTMKMNKALLAAGLVVAASFTAFAAEAPKPKANTMGASL